MNVYVRLINLQELKRTTKQSTRDTWNQGAGKQDWTDPSRRVKLRTEGEQEVNSIRLGFSG